MCGSPTWLKNRWNDRRINRFATGWRPSMHDPTTHASIEAWCRCSNPPPGNTLISPLPNQWHRTRPPSQNSHRPRPGCHFGFPISSIRNTKLHDPECPHVETLKNSLKFPSNTTIHQTLICSSWNPEPCSHEEPQEKQKTKGFSTSLSHQEWLFFPQTLPYVTLKFT